MELVDIYNNKHEKLGYSKNRKELNDGEYRLSCFVWIINDKGKILIHQRLATARKYPNMWGTTAGGACEGEDGLTGTIRELKEELGIAASKDDIYFIGSFARTNDFVEVYLFKYNCSKKDLKLQKDEVQDAKWVTIPQFENMIEDGIVCDTSYSVFKDFYTKYYNKKTIFVDGKAITIDNK